MKHENYQMIAIISWLQKNIPTDKNLLLLCSHTHKVKRKKNYDFIIQNFTKFSILRTSHDFECTLRK